MLKDIKCHLCGKIFWGMAGKEDTCKDCLKLTMNKEKLKTQWLEVFGKNKDVSVEQVTEFLEKSDLGDLQLYYLSDTRGGYWYEWRLSLDKYFHGYVEVVFALDYNFLLDVYNFETLWSELENVIEEADKTKNELNY